jgi:hypothetical protein
MPTCAISRLQQVGQHLRGRTPRRGPRRLIAWSRHLARTPRPLCRDTDRTAGVRRPRSPPSFLSRGRRYTNCGGGTSAVGCRSLSDRHQRQPESSRCRAATAGSMSRIGWGRRVRLPVVIGAPPELVRKNGRGGGARGPAPAA